MSFIKKAQEAAEAARARVEEAASAATRTAQDPSTAERVNRGLAGATQGARDAVGVATRGVNTVIERIDPGTLADLIIKATALQEMTNKALRTKARPIGSRRSRSPRRSRPASPSRSRGWTTSPSRSTGR